MPQVKPRHDKRRNKTESFDQMLRRFKKKCERAGIVSEVRAREHYVKPNQKRHLANQKRKRKAYLNKIKEQKEKSRARLASRWINY
tara:strand:+ start:1155 stop:1412 length:258 start_codon:yes stop_codon:yes gene_type:complete